jgi:hypothetical protein
VIGVHAYGEAALNQGNRTMCLAPKLFKLIHTWMCTYQLKDLGLKYVRVNV